MINQVMVVLQGQPGAGKSTLARNYLVPVLELLGHDVVICDTDDEFMVNGEYVFDLKKLGENHQKTQRKADNAIQHFKSVIITNTNIHNYEVKPYVKIAQKYHVPIVFLRVTGNYHSIHNVPAATVDRMIAEMENLSVEAALASKAPWEN